MTKDEAKNVLMDTFKAAWCTDCVVWDEPVWSNCNEYCDAYKQFKEAIAVLEKSDDSKGFSDSAEPSIVRCKDCLQKHIGGSVTHYYWCDRWEMEVDDTDYCAWAERREP